MSGRLDSVLWDMDGTLIDSEPAWFAAQTQIVGQHGGTWSRADALALVGSDMPQTVAAMQAAGTDLTGDEIATRLTLAVRDALATSLEWRPGAFELVSALATVGIPQAIVTTSSRAVTGVVVDALPAATIRLTVTGDDVTRGKPDPEPYLLAAALLGCDIIRCAVIEDSLIGLTAGAASGAKVVGVPHDLELPTSPQWTLWSTLAGKTPRDLEGLMSG
ncbi:HAD family phosphatase [Rathayibacter sp. SD072]|uniref:HAD family hydrolase n=1 Tax=Rathayibacter sp. SD072 TaxID=2781731 RepID=UPI001A97AD72|nr:HAD family phosphatase [Rathayibacter sp. SD072]MBO0982673.1 HAD family phosphatase [Rathayibacter sp. SD072]